MYNNFYLNVKFHYSRKSDVLILQENSDFFPFLPRLYRSQYSHFSFKFKIAEDDFVSLSLILSINYLR